MCLKCIQNLAFSFNVTVITVNVVGIHASGIVVAYFNGKEHMVGIFISYHHRISKRMTCSGTRIFHNVKSSSIKYHSNTALMGIEHLARNHPSKFVIFTVPSEAASGCKKLHHVETSRPSVIYF